MSGQLELVSVIKKVHKFKHIYSFFTAEAAGSCLGELGPVDFSTIALLHGRDLLYEKAVSFFTSTESQCLYIILNCMNDALTQRRYGES